MPKTPCSLKPYGQSSSKSLCLVFNCIPGLQDKVLLETEKLEEF